MQDKTTARATLKAMVTMHTDEAIALLKAVDSQLSKDLGEAIRAAVDAGTVVRIDWSREQAATAIHDGNRVLGLFEAIRRNLKHQHQTPAATTLSRAVRRIQDAHPDVDGCNA